MQPEHASGTIPKPKLEQPASSNNRGWLAGFVRLSVVTCYRSASKKSPLCPVVSANLSNIWRLEPRTEWASLGSTCKETLGSFLSAYGRVEKVPPAALQLRQCVRWLRTPDLPKLRTIPTDPQYRDRQMIVVLECRRLHYASYMRVSHLAKFCPLKPTTLNNSKNSAKEDSQRNFAKPAMAHNPATLPTKLGKVWKQPDWLDGPSRLGREVSSGSPREKWTCQILLGQYVS